MKNLKDILAEGILGDIDTSLNKYDLGRSLPEVIELLKDPLSAHYTHYSPNEFEKGVKRERSTVYIITPENKKKWCGNYKTPTDLYKDKGQPGWEKLYKLAKSNLKDVDSKVANDKNNTCGDFIVFTKPSKSNNFHKAKIMKIDIIRKNAEIHKSNRYLEISFACDDTLTYTGYHTNQHDRFPTPFSGWDVEIFDLNSNPHWSGLIVEEIFKQLPYIGYGTIDTNKLLKRYPPIFAPINS